jgi:hypothetical protein
MWNHAVDPPLLETFLSGTGKEFLLPNKRHFNLDRIQAVPRAAPPEETINHLMARVVG